MQYFLRSTKRTRDEGDEEDQGGEGDEGHEGDEGDEGNKGDEKDEGGEKPRVMLTQFGTDALGSFLRPKFAISASSSTWWPKFMRLHMMAKFFRCKWQVVPSGALVAKIAMVE